MFPSVLDRRCCGRRRIMASSKRFRRQIGGIGWRLIAKTIHYHLEIDPQDAEVNEPLL